MKRDLIPQLSLEEQYLVDLEFIRREEERIVEEGGSPADTEFFSRMGELAGQRMRSAA